VLKARHGAIVTNVRKVLKGVGFHPGGSQVNLGARQEPEFL